MFDFAANASPSEPRVEQNDWLVGADDQKVPGQIARRSICCTCLEEDEIGVCSKRILERCYTSLR